MEAFTIAKRWMEVLGLEIDKEEFEKILKELAEKYIEYQRKIKEEFEKHLNREELENISKEELVETLYWAMYQACYYAEEGYADSLALSAYADALRLLARLGLFEIESEYGRRVIGKFKI